MKRSGSAKTKTLWRDIGDLRLRNSILRVGGAAKWWAAKLGLSPEAVVMVRPGGKRARSDKTLKSLRREWMEEGR